MISFALQKKNWSLPTDTFTFMHLADAFIQSDLQCIQAIHLYCQYVCSLGIEPTRIWEWETYTYKHSSGSVVVWECFAILELQIKS